MDTCVVFYESWQMECCGTAFQTGDPVNWLVRQCDSLLTPVAVGRVAYCYEAHDSSWTTLFVLTGRVERIQILYESYAPTEENPRMLKAVGGMLVPADAARGFERPLDDLEPSGYLVEISGCSVRPAKKEEVTFR